MVRGGAARSGAARDGAAQDGAPRRAAPRTHARFFSFLPPRFLFWVFPCPCWRQSTQGLTVFKTGPVIASKVH